MNLGYLFTSFEGRINRKPYWLAILVLVVIMVVLSFAAGIILAIGGGGGLMVQIVLIVVIAYPATALMVKRLHDRDRPTWMVAIFWAPSVLSILGQLTGISGAYVDGGGFSVFEPNTLGWIIIALSLGVGIWALVELGFLRGTDGPNQYGPDPLQSKTGS